MKWYEWAIIGLLALMMLRPKEEAPPEEEVAPPVTPTVEPTPEEEAEGETLTEEVKEVVEEATGTVPETSKETVEWELGSYTVTRVNGVVTSVHGTIPMKEFRRLTGSITMREYTERKREALEARKRAKARAGRKVLV